MNDLVQESADWEINRAIIEDKQANAHYYQILRRYISSKSVIAGEKLRQPDVKLDAGGLKEIDTTWFLLQTTGKNLCRTYMKLYAAYL